MEPIKFIAMIAQGTMELQKQNSLFPSLTIAQSALETGWGKFIPKDKYSGKESYNLFGVKGSGPAGSVICATWEVYDGKRVEIDAKFKAYNNWEESLQDYYKVLMQDRYLPVRQAKTPFEAAGRLYICGYATDPGYPNKLISIIKDYDLTVYDKQVSPGPFSDVSADHWAASHITIMKENGLMRGDETGKFNPEVGLTRAEFAHVFGTFINMMDSFFIKTNLK